MFAWELRQTSLGADGVSSSYKGVTGPSLHYVGDALSSLFGVDLTSKRVDVFAATFSSLPYYGTAKSLTAYSMVRDGLKRGLLRPGCVVVEPTSGNTGLALAEILRSIGVPFVMVVSRKISRAFEEELAERFGAKTLEVTDPTSIAPVLEFLEHHEGEVYTLLVKLPVNYCPTDEPTGAIAYVKKLVAEGGGRIVMLDQYTNTSNPEVHREITAPAVLEATHGLLAGGRRLYVFLSGGTFGTALGLAQSFFERGVDAKLVVVLPRGEDVFGVVDLENAKRRRFYKELVTLESKSGADLFEVVEVDEPLKKVSEMWVFNREMLGRSRADLTGGYSSMLVLWCALRYIEERGLRDAVCVLLFHDSMKMYSEPKPLREGLGGEEEEGSLLVEPELAQKMVVEQGARIVYVDPIPAPMPDEVRLSVRRELEGAFHTRVGEDDVKNIGEVFVLDGATSLREAELNPTFYEQLKSGLDSKPLILVCPHGGTSRLLAQRLRRLGAEKVFSLKGGLRSLTQAQEAEN